MKVSEWLRQYLLTGKVPEEAPKDVAFWGGWLLGTARQSSQIAQPNEREFPLTNALEMAIKAAEFIEAQR